MRERERENIVYNYEFESLEKHDGQLRDTNTMTTLKISIAMAFHNNNNFSSNVSYHYFQY